MSMVDFGLLIAYPGAVLPRLHMSVDMGDKNEIAGPPTAWICVAYQLLLTLHTKLQR